MLPQSSADYLFRELATCPSYDLGECLRGVENMGPCASSRLYIIYMSVVFDSLVELTYFFFSSNDLAARCKAADSLSLAYLQLFFEPKTNQAMLRFLWAQLSLNPVELPSNAS